MKRFGATSLWLVLCCLIACQIPVICDSNSKFMTSQVLPNLLRFDFNGDTATNNFGDLFQFKCNGVGKKRKCSIDDSSFTNLQSDSEATSYMQGVAMYGAVNIAGLVVLIVLTAVWVVCGLFCMIINACGCCTRKAKSMIPPSRRDKLVYLITLAFTVIIFIIIILGQVVGGSTLFEFISAIADAPKGTADIYYSEVTPVGDLVVSVSSTVLVPLIYSVNKTFNDGISVSQVNEDLLSTNHSFYQMPNVDTVRMLVNNVDEDINASVYIIDSIDGHVADLLIIKQNITDKADIVRSDLHALDSIMQNVSASIETCSDLMQNISTANVKLFGDGSSSGEVDEIVADLETICRSSVIGECFPVGSAFDEAAHNTISSLDKLIAGDMDGVNLNNLDALITKLSDLYVAVAVLPDYSATASKIRDVNHTMFEICGPAGTVDHMVDALNELQSQLHAASDTTAFMSDTSNLLAATRMLSLNGLRSDIMRLDTLITTVPDQIDMLADEVRKFPEVVPEIIPILYDLAVTQVESFNATMFKAPIDTRKSFDKINTTLYDSVATAEDLLDELQNARQSVVDINISSYLIQIDIAQDALDNQINSFNFTALVDQINSMSSQLNISFQSYIDELRSFQDAFKSYYFSENEVSALDVFQSSRAALESDLRDAVSVTGYTGSTWDTPASADGLYLVLASGVCDADTTVLCSSDSDCVSVGGVCGNIGVYRCSSNGNGATAVTPCTADADCSGLGGGSTCLADSSRAINLQTELLIFAADTVFPDTSGLLNNVNGVVSNEYDTTSINNQLDQTASDTTIVDTNEYANDLDQVISGIETFDFSSINATLQDVRTTIDGLNTTSLDDILDEVDQKRTDAITSINSVLWFMDGLVDFLYSPTQLHRHLQRLSADRLKSIRATSGVGPTIMASAAELDAMYNTIRSLVQRITDVKIKIPKHNISNDFSDFALQMDRAEANPNNPKSANLRSYGSLYYMMSQYPALRDTMIDGDDPKADTVTTNTDGDKYPNGDVCLSDDCFQATQDEVSSQPIDYMSVSLGVSAASLVGLVWLPIGVVFLLALLLFLCPICVSDKHPRWRACPATCMLILLIIMIPLYMLGTALYFPMAIVLSDACNTWTNVPKNYVMGMGNAMCDNIDGTGSLNSCNLHSSKNGYDVTLDIEAIVDGLLGSCSSGQDPFTTPLIALADQAVDSVNTRINREIENNKIFKNMRAPLKQVLLDAADNSGKSLSDFLTTSVNVLNCDAMSAIVEDMLSPVCDDFAGAFGWFSAMLYLASWTMCCIGIPAGCVVQHNSKWTRHESDSLEEVDDESDDSNESSNSSDGASSDGGSHSDTDSEDSAVKTKKNNKKKKPKKKKNGRPRSASEEQRANVQEFLRASDPNIRDSLPRSSTGARESLTASAGEGKYAAVPADGAATANAPPRKDSTTSGSYAPVAAGSSSNVTLSISIDEDRPASSASQKLRKSPSSMRIGGGKQWGIKDDDAASAPSSEMAAIYPAGSTGRPPL